MESLFVYITELDSQIAYFIIFFVLVACGLGLPLPEDIPLVAAGYLCWKGTLTWDLALFFTLFGVLLGDSMLYLIGAKIGPAIINGETVQSYIKPSRLRRGRAYFRKYGVKIVFFARFVAGFRAAVFFTAGATRLPFRKFIILDGAAALLSVPIWIGLGHWLGHRWGTQIEEGLAHLEKFKTVITVVILGLVIAAVARAVWKYRQNRKEQKALKKSKD